MMKKEVNLENNFNSICDKNWEMSDLTMKKSLSLSI